MTQVIDDIIEVKLVASRPADSSICIVCDDYSASRVRAKVSRSFCVCPHCLRSANFDARLAARAEEFTARAEKFTARAQEFMTRASRLKQTAASLRTLIGKIGAPTFEQWLDAEAQAKVDEAVACSRVTKEERKKALAKLYKRHERDEPADGNETECRAEGANEQGNAEDADRDDFLRSLHVDDSLLHDGSLPWDNDLPF